jgi:hypothetical protein
MRQVDFVRRLALPERRGWQGHHDRRHEGCEAEPREPRPDDPPGTGVAVDLGKNVPENIGDGEEQGSRAHDERADHGQFQLRDLGRADQVRADQHGDKRRHYEFKIAIAAPFAHEIRKA